MIEFNNFSFRYGDAEEFSLKKIDLTINDGEFVLISGPSGGGKSSLCRCINGLIPHFYGGHISGDAKINGMSILNNTPRDLAPVVGMTFQDPENQLTATDVEREVVFGMENLGFDRKLMSKRLEEALDSIGIAHLRHRVIPELSGGEKQKVAIASVLALHPRILVMDEPTSELDPKGAEEVLSVVQRLNDELGLTVVLVEHRLERVFHLVDRVILIHHGELIADGSPREVFSAKQTEDIGIGIPPMIVLANRLKENGAEIETAPLTVKEGRKIFEKVFVTADKRHSGKVTLASPASDACVQVNNLWYRYESEHVALRDISVDFFPGQLTAIMGRNASGKSTLMKNINGLLKPTRGQVLTGGMDTRKTSIAQLSKTIGMVFQNPNDHLFADTVEEEISMTLNNRDWTTDAKQKRTEELLDMFGLVRYRKQYPRYLSGGEKQRVALATAIAARPEILVLDEPTRGMDFSLKRYLMLFLRGYCAQGNSVILVSHDVETVAEYADRVILMSEGQIIVDGDRYEVLSEALLFSPQINRLVQSLQPCGLAPDTLTVNEIMESLG